MKSANTLKHTVEQVHRLAYLHGKPFTPAGLSLWLTELSETSVPAIAKVSDSGWLRLRAAANRGVREAQRDALRKEHLGARLAQRLAARGGSK